MRLFKVLRSTLVSLVLLSAALAASAQGDVQAVMLSDIHFDPFHNPRIVGQLRSAPVGQWPAILNAHQTLIEDADVRAIQLECRSRALDTPWTLFQGTLAAARQAQPHPSFVTLSGDLLTHQFPCRFHHFAPSATPQEQAAFAAKTVIFVIEQLRKTFPNVPVYTALGNNDSGCFDYQETPGDFFLQATGRAMVAAAEAGLPPKLLKRKRLEASPLGDYSIALPAPLEHGRLIALDDIYGASGFRSCAGKADRSTAQAQAAWLRAQLTDARTRHEQVWVMGHIPPGVDVYVSFLRYLLRPAEVCSVQPRNFLSDSSLADALLAYSDVVRLGLFAHTHMDEIRILHHGPSEAGNSGVRSSPEAAIPIKLVPSVTTYAGNHPAFLVAQIDPHTLVLKDWETFVSPSSDGSPLPWPMTYRYTSTYVLPDFSGASAETLADALAGDRAGKAPRATAYRDHFYAGGGGLYALGLGQIWPAYSCAIRETGPEAFHDCLCPAPAPAAGQP